MILREYISNHIGKKAKIGFKDGSSFIFCDEITENTLELLETMREETSLRTPSRVSLSASSPIPDREIVETYKSCFGGEIVLIQGKGAGRFWTYEEYEKCRPVAQTTI